MLGSRFLMLMAFLIPVLGLSQVPDRFQALLQSAPSQGPQRAVSKMEQFITELSVKRSKLSSDEAFLRYTFLKTHKTFFKSYKAHSQFPEIFDSGNYDCLSATSLFSVILDAFGFEYKIIETNYHIFLKVEVDKNEILLETTDRINGYISDGKAITAKLANYREYNNHITDNSEWNFYQYGLDIFQEVHPHQLLGLLYFNQAIVAFNTNDLSECMLKLKKASSIISNPRIIKLAVLLVTKVAESEMEYEKKKSLILPFGSLIKERESLLSSR